jgi:hypothetical protein
VFRACENDILHFAAAERLYALFAKDPSDCICYVAFAAAVRTDYGCYTAAEIKAYFFRKGFETLHVKSL